MAEIWLDQAILCDDDGSVGWVGGKSLSLMPPLPILGACPRGCWLSDDVGIGVDGEYIDVKWLCCKGHMLLFDLCVIVCLPWCMRVCVSVAVGNERWRRGHSSTLLKTPDTFTTQGKTLCQGSACVVSGMFYKLVSPTHSDWTDDEPSPQESIVSRHTHSRTHKFLPSHTHKHTQSTGSLQCP